MHETCRLGVNPTVIKIRHSVGPGITCCICRVSTEYVPQTRPHVKRIPYCVARYFRMKQQNLFTEVHSLDPFMGKGEDEGKRDDKFADDQRSSKIDELKEGT